MKEKEKETKRERENGPKIVLCIVLFDFTLILSRLRNTASMQLLGEFVECGSVTEKGKKTTTPATVTNDTPNMRKFAGDVKEI